MLLQVKPRVLPLVNNEYSGRTIGCGIAVRNIGLAILRTTNIQGEPLVVVFQVKPLVLPFANNEYSGWTIGYGIAGRTIGLVICEQLIFTANHWLRYCRSNHLSCHLRTTNIQGEPLVMVLQVKPLVLPFANNEYSGRTIGYGIAGRNIGLVICEQLISWSNNLICYCRSNHWFCHFRTMTIQVETLVLLLQVELLVLSFANNEHPGRTFGFAIARRTIDFAFFEQQISRSKH